MIGGLHRGSVWVADFQPPIGRRPVVVLTRDAAIPVLTNVTVALITRSAVGSPAEVPLGAAEGLRQDCVANCDNIHTVAVRQLVSRVGELGPERLQRLAGAIRIALDV